MGFVMLLPVFTKLHLCSLPYQACHRNNIKFCCSFLPRLFMYLAGQDQQVYILGLAKAQALPKSRRCRTSPDGKAQALSNPVSRLAQPRPANPPFCQSAEATL